jgi:hypothetical protein
MQAKQYGIFKLRVPLPEFPKLTVPEPAVCSPGLEVSGQPGSAQASMQQCSGNAMHHLSSDAMQQCSGGVMQLTLRCAASP